MCCSLRSLSILACLSSLVFFDLGSEDEAVLLLRTADFSDEHYPALDEAIRGRCYGFMNGLVLGRDMNWDMIARFLAMMGIRSKELLNETLDVCPPYGVTYCSKHSETVWPQLRELYPGVWKDTYYTDAVKKANEYR